MAAGQIVGLKNAGVCRAVAAAAAHIALDMPGIPPFLAASAHAMLEPMPRPALAIPRLSLPVRSCICLGIVAGRDGCILAMGRIPICKCGYSSSGTAAAAIRRCRST